MTPLFFPPRLRASAVKNNEPQRHEETKQVIPAQAGIHGHHSPHGFRVKPGMTTFFSPPRLRASAVKNL